MSKWLHNKGSPEIINIYANQTAFPNLRYSYNWFENLSSVKGRN